MIIDGRNYDISVLILSMEEEIGVTLQTIETLLENVEDGVTISLLLNGARNEELRRQLESHRKVIRYYESDANLGVAGGRNSLLGTDECQSADIVLILDNDVVPPTDYIRSLAMFVVRHPEAGVVGAVVADINTCLSLGLSERQRGRGTFGSAIFQITCDQLKALLAPQLQSRNLFHIGAHPDYYYTYFSARPTLHVLANALLGWSGTSSQGEPFLARNASYVAKLRNGVGSYTVSNVAGCSQAFRRALLSEIGELEDRYSPYGFEDVDFCIRALRAGYTNYIDGHTWLLHGTDQRHKARDPLRTQTNFYRCRTILASRMLPAHRYPLVIWKLMAVNLLLDGITARRDTLARFRARYEGFRIAQQDLKQGPAT